MVFFLTKDRDDYLRMYFIMDKCDPPGVFRCEALIRAHNNPRAEMPIRREFDAETTKEGKVESTCMPSSFSITFYDYCFRFLVARKIHCILHWNCKVCNESRITLKLNELIFNAYIYVNVFRQEIEYRELLKLLYLHLTKYFEYHTKFHRILANFVLILLTL